MTRGVIGTATSLSGGASSRSRKRSYALKDRDCCEGARAPSTVLVARVVTAHHPTAGLFLESLKGVVLIPRPLDIISGAALGNRSIVQ